MKPPNKVGMANVRNQAPLSTLSTIDFIEALSLTRGNGILGIGSPRNWHRGSQPFLSKKKFFIDEIINLNTKANFNTVLNLC